MSNDKVFRRVGCCAISSLLLEQQLILFGKYARTNGSSCRQVILKDDSLDPLSVTYRRSRGRPRATWIRGISQQISQLPSKDSFKEAINNAEEWRKFCRSYCREISERD